MRYSSTIVSSHQTPQATPFLYDYGTAAQVYSRLHLPHCALTAPVQERASCTNIHVCDARETTTPAGYGSAGIFIHLSI